MRALLLDKGLPQQVAESFQLLKIDAHAVGQGVAPPDDSSDTFNCEWCAARGAVLVTNDRGKGNREILTALAQTGVDAIFVYDDLRAAPRHEFARALICAEAAIDQIGAKKKPIRHRLSPSGRLKQKVNH